MSRPDDSLETLGLGTIIILAIVVGIAAARLVT